MPDRQTLEVAKSAAMLTGLAATSAYTAVVFATYAIALWQAATVAPRYKRQVDEGRAMMMKRRSERGK